MGLQIAAQRRRLRVNIAANTITDQQTGRVPVLFRNSVTKLDLGVFFGGAIADLTGFSALDLDLYAAAPTAGASSALNATTSTIDVDPTDAEWEALTAQHGTLDVDDGATWPAAGSYYWTLTGTVTGGTVVLGSGSGLTIADAGPANP